MDAALGRLLAAGCEGLDSDHPWLPEWLEDDEGLLEDVRMFVAARTGPSMPSSWRPTGIPSEFECYDGSYDVDAYLDSLSGDWAEIERARLCPEY